MPGWTNKGKMRALAVWLRAATPPTNLFIALFTNAAAPNPDTNIVGDLTQIAAGNGYSSGGASLNRNSTDFDTLTEDDTNDRGLVQLKDIVFTASGGPIPASGSGARYAAMTDDNATVGSREIYTFWDLSSDRTVSDGQSLTLQDFEIRLTE
jgi:hypothetical protein